MSKEKELTKFPIKMENKLNKEKDIIQKLIDNISKNTIISELEDKLNVEFQKLLNKTNDPIKLWIRANVLEELQFNDIANLFKIKAKSLGYIIENKNRNNEMNTIETVKEKINNLSFKPTRFVVNIIEDYHSNTGDPIYQDAKSYITIEDAYEEYIKALVNIEDNLGDEVMDYKTIELIATDNNNYDFEVLLSETYDVDYSDDYGKLVIVYQHVGKGMNYAHEYKDLFWLDKYTEKQLSNNLDSRYSNWTKILDITKDDLNGLNIDEAIELILKEANLKLSNSISEDDLFNLSVTLNTIKDENIEEVDESKINESNEINIELSINIRFKDEITLNAVKTQIINMCNDVNIKNNIIEKTIQSNINMLEINKEENNIEENNIEDETIVEQLNNISNDDIINTIFVIYPNVSLALKAYNDNRNTFIQEIKDELGIKILDEDIIDDYFLGLGTVETIELVHVYDDVEKTKLFGTGELAMDDSGKTTKTIDNKQYTFIKFDSTNTKWVESDKVKLVETYKQQFIYNPNEEKIWNMYGNNTLPIIEKDKYNARALRYMIDNDAFLKFSYHNLGTGDEKNDLDMLYDTYIDGDDDMIAKLRSFESYVYRLLENNMQNDKIAKLITDTLDEFGIEIEDNRKNEGIYTDVITNFTEDVKKYINKAKSAYALFTPDVKAELKEKLKDLTLKDFVKKIKESGITFDDVKKYALVKENNSTNPLVEKIMKAFNISLLAAGFIVMIMGVILPGIAGILYLGTMPATYLFGIGVGICVLSGIGLGITS